MYVYRHHSGISKPEAHWAGRARHIYDTKKHSMRVKLSPLKLEDEGAYSCEITYEEPGRWFKDSCLDPQLTMVGNIWFFSPLVLSNSEKNVLVLLS